MCLEIEHAADGRYYFVPHDMFYHSVPQIRSRQFSYIQQQVRGNALGSPPAPSCAMMLSTSSKDELDHLEVQTYACVQWCLDWFREAEQPRPLSVGLRPKPGRRTNKDPSSELKAKTEFSKLNLSLQTS